MKIEVFKTNVVDQQQAKWLADQIAEHFANCRVNFDLEDRDRILRVAFEGSLQYDQLIDLVRNAGYYAEVLSDTIHSDLQT